MALAVLRLTRLVVAHTAPRAAYRRRARPWPGSPAPLLGVQIVARRAGRGPGRRRAGLRPRPARSGRACSDRAVRAGGRGRRRSSDTPADQLLTGLRGKDVVLTFVESYGRGRGRGPDVRAAGRRLLDAGTARLEAAGFGARSAFLTSPTAGGGSWLAHCDAAVRAVDRQPAALPQPGLQRPADPHQRVPAGGLAHGRRRCRRSRAPGRRAGSSATTRSTTRANLGYPGRGSATRRCPTSTRCRPFQRASAAARPRAGDGRDRRCVEPRAVGADPADGRLGRRRRRLGLRRRRRAGRADRRATSWQRPDQVRADVRHVHRVLAGQR